MPPIAPNTPRDMSVGFAGAPVRVLVEACSVDASRWRCINTDHALTASMSMPYEQRARCGMMESVVVGRRFPC